MFGDSRHTDFTIICEGDDEQHNLRVHKIVLCARSPVFAAMLESHTEETQKGQVYYDDIEFEVLFT
jgi:hypothetical protein